VVSGEKELVAGSPVGHAIAIPPAPRAPVRALAAKAVVRRAAGRLPFRVLNAADGTGTAGEPVLVLRRPAPFYRRLGAGGMTGFGARQRRRRRQHAGIGAARENRPLA
jgi:hypothetical protein